MAFNERRNNNNNITEIEQAYVCVIYFMCTNFNMRHANFTFIKVIFTTGLNMALLKNNNNNSMKSYNNYFF